MTTTRRFKALQKRLGVEAGDPDTLRRAFVHRSYLNESRSDAEESNERLEFLGDAIVGFVVAEYLFDRFPHLAEGELTALRAALVRTETLAKAARRLKLGDCLIVGRSIDKQGGRERPHLLACTFEALIAVLHADEGIDHARRVVLEALRPELDKLVAGDSVKAVVKDAKSRFQEEVLARWHVTPRYRTVAAEGADHQRRYEAAVLVAGETVGLGTGATKQQAQQAAARAALDRLEAGWQPEQIPEPDGNTRGAVDPIDVDPT